MWLGLVAVEVVPSPKVHAWVLIVPPESVDESVKVVVRPLLTKLKFAVGVPPAVATVTEEVLALVLPLTLSVTVSDTLYVPAAA